MRRVGLTGSKKMSEKEIEEAAAEFVSYMQSMNSLSVVYPGIKSIRAVMAKVRLLCPAVSSMHLPVFADTWEGAGGYKEAYTKMLSILGTEDGLFIAQARGDENNALKWLTERAESKNLVVCVHPLQPRGEKTGETSVLGVG